ncbi:U3 small nucleolar RNA-associated protein 18 [Elysia marginata]|uniref:U3 small nucleolar RNA-associated protein 18 n=1 Tax=Elysia marginata TaxID=1093978 RepID=A0AAV4JGB8_9GAST|nr:U3 small nucleolar RNA-associated protein 18 [Elysia marginata]
MLRRRRAVPSNTKSKTNVSTVKAKVLGDTQKDDREAALEEEILGVGENIIDALPHLEVAKKERKRKKRTDAATEVKKWHDSDDEQLAEYETNNPSWAARFDDDKSDATFYIVAQDCLKCVEFHPKATVLMTGGNDQTVRLFAIDGSQNRKIHSIFLERCPVYCCRFSRGGSEIVMGSKHKSFYIYDMEGSSGITFRPKLKGLEVRDTSRFVISPDGRFIAFFGEHGYIHLFSQDSKELIDSVKMNGLVASVCFSKDGQLMYTFGSMNCFCFPWKGHKADSIGPFIDCDAFKVNLL